MTTLSIAPKDMEISLTICENRAISAALLIAVANIAFTALLSESRVLLSSGSVLNTTSIGQNTFEVNRQDISQVAVQAELKLQHFEMGHEIQVSALWTQFMLIGTAVCGNLHRLTS